MMAGIMPRKTIVAIGGGEIARRGAEADTIAIDRAIVALARKDRPRLLFFPAASDDSGQYIVDVQTLFGSLGCDVTTLRTAGGKTTHSQARQQLLSADIVYVGGGQTDRLLRRIHDLDLADTLSEAYENGIILSGLSAGAMCWFWFRPADSDITAPRLMSKWGLGLVRTIVCPHFDTQEELREDFWSNLPDGKTGIGLEDCTALVVADDTYYSLSSRPGSRAFRCTRRGDSRSRHALEDTVVHPITDLELVPT